VGVRKVRVAIEAAELDWARERAEREGTSPSAVLTRATREAREAEARRERQRVAWEAFEHWATRGAGLGAEDLDAAERELSAEPRAALGKRRRGTTAKRTVGSRRT
jgi:hypothetical protein